ncbi:16531_t:CDS:2, partial [Acaulospora morrowiae]
MSVYWSWWTRNNSSELHEDEGDDGLQALGTNGICEVIFHVHMPNGFDKSQQPFVIGSVKELGSWNTPVVKLRQKDTDSTYWFSDPVKIQIRDQSIYYKYALYQPEEQIITEGNAEYVGRILSYKGFQYDVWENNHSKELYRPDIEADCKFVVAIHESVTLKNLREKIMEFQELSKCLPSYTAGAIDMDTIHKLVLSSREYQQSFLCFLLAYYIDVTRKNNQKILLPDNFPSIELLQAIQKIKNENLPSNAKTLFALATSALVRHNSSKRNVFDWMKMFAIAPVVDPSYTFLVNIEKHDYDQGDEILHFHNELKRNVKPYLDRIDKQYYHMAIEVNDISIESLFVPYCVIDVDTNHPSIELHSQKIIEISFLNMESCNFLILEMIGKERMDQRIKGYMRGLIRQCIQFDDPQELEQHFRSISKDIHTEYASVFRDKFFELLSNNGSPWRTEYSEPMFQLFSQLFKEESGIIQVLELLSNSRNEGLLLSFPMWSRFALESRNNNTNFGTKISSLCVKWYTTVISVVTNQSNGENLVVLFYRQLSAISFVHKGGTDIYSNLLKIVEQKISNLPQDLLFLATSFINELESHIVKDFSNFLVSRLNSSLDNTTDEDTLIRIISQICNSSDSSLHVPNSLCQVVLCYMLRVIQDKNDDDDHLRRLYFKLAKFWIFLLNATGEVKELFNHSCVKRVREKISQLVCTMKNQSIKTGLLSELVEYSNDRLINCINAVIGPEGKIITNELLDSFREKLRDHSNTIQNLKSFYSKWCVKAVGVQFYLDDLTEKKNNSAFLEVIHPHYWLIHEKIIQVSRKAYQYKDSQTFANIFEADTNEEAQKSVVLVSLAIENYLLKKYQRICLDYKNWQRVKCSEARPFWNGIANEQVKRELNQMAGDTTWYQHNQTHDDLLKSIEYLAHIPSSIRHLKILSEVLTQFNVKNGEKSWAVEMLNTLENGDMVLGGLSEFFLIYDLRFSAYEECWSIIEALSLAKEFIDFLFKELVGRDLTNLINAVDDQSSTKLLRENTVVALIEVNKALDPLSKEASRSSIDSFLDCLSEVSKKNPSLTTKIITCNTHNLALQNMYRNIANRGEVTKEKIKNVVTIGLYTFQHVERTDLCEVMLTYDTTQNQPRVTDSYNLADLHDLYSRALFIGKSIASVDRSKGENDVKNINTFITQVDLVRQIIEVNSKLIRLGHFLYQNMKIEARGVSELQDVLDKLTQDLKTWEDMVDRAQNKHYYLTFFSAHHILAFYNYFRADNHERDSDKLKEVCQNIIRFVNDAAQLPIPTGKLNAVQSKDDFFPVLCNIGVILYNIFSDIPRQIRSIPDILKPVIADTVFSGQIFVAA